MSARQQGSDAHNIVSLTLIFLFYLLSLVCTLLLTLQSLLAEWRVILTDIGVPFRQELSLRQYLSTAKQRLEWQVRPGRG